jgi:hypothetical protein
VETDLRDLQSFAQEPEHCTGRAALGLAKVGFRVTGTAFSPRAIERARAEALERGLDLRLYVADMLYLNAVPETGFDAVILHGQRLTALSMRREPH